MMLQRKQEGYVHTLNVSTMSFFDIKNLMQTNAGLVLFSRGCSGAPAPVTFLEINVLHPQILAILLHRVVFHARILRIFNSPGMYRVKITGYCVRSSGFDIKNTNTKLKICQCTVFEKLRVLVYQSIICSQTFLTYFCC